MAIRRRHSFSARRLPGCGNGYTLSFDDLNAYPEQSRLERQGATLRGHNKTIVERLMSDLDALMGLPVAEYEACDHVCTRATSISMLRYRSWSTKISERLIARLFPAMICSSTSRILPVLGFEITLTEQVAPLLSTTPSQWNLI